MSRRPTPEGGRFTTGLALAASGATLGLLTLIAAAPESPFHPPLPAGTQALAPLRWLVSATGLEALSRDGLAGAAIVGILAACAAFFYVVWEAWHGRLSVRTALWFGVACNLLMLAVPLLMSRDVYSYAMYGKIHGIYGANPYVSVPADFPNDPLLALTGPKWNQTPAVYGPLFSLVSSLMVKVVSSVTAQVLAFRLLAVVAGITTLFVVRAFVGRVAPERTAFALVMIGWNPVVLFHSVASGHNDLWVGLAVVTGLWLAWRAHPGWAAVALALGMSVKVTAVLPLLLLLVWVAVRAEPGRRMRAALPVVAAGAATWLVTALPFLNTSDPSLGMLNLAGHEGWLAPSKLFRRTLEGWFDALGWDVVGALAGALVRIAFPLILLAVLAGLVRHLMRLGAAAGPEELGAAWAWSLVALMLTGPVLLPWYITWVLPLAFVVTRVPRRALVWLSVLLAASEVVAEPLTSRDLFEDVLVAAHYVITIGVFVVLVWLLRDLRSRLREGAPLSGVEVAEDLA
jgi:hypothetical protein